MGRGQGTLIAATRGSGTRQRGQQRWTPERLRAELLAFLEGRDEWPTVAEFRAAGRIDLYDAALRHGGAQRWATDLGFAYRKPSGGYRGRLGAYKWTFARLGEELEAFLRDREDWPSASEFRAAGRSDLYEAVRQHGGVERWAATMQKKLRPGVNRAPYPTHRAVQDARAVIAEHGGLPNADRLRQLGYGRLATLVSQSGGAAAFLRAHALSDSAN